MQQQSASESGNAETPGPIPHLTQQHVDWVYCVCRRAVRDPALAEDVTQTVFLALLKKSGRISPANISGWLFKAARHCCNRALRDGNTRRRHELAAGRMRGDAVRMEANMDDDELILQLEEQIARLGKVDRVAVLLRYYERRSLRDVGTALGISEEAANKRVRRAVEKLRVRMAGRKIPLGAETLGAILAEKLVQPAPAKVTAAVLAHAVHGTAASAVTTAQPTILSHGPVKALISGKGVFAVGSFALAAALVAVGISAVLAKHRAAAKAREGLIISRATTYLTSPLDRKGLPDYMLAMAQYLMKGVTPQNNAAVPAIEIAMQGYNTTAVFGQKVDYRKLGAYQLKLLGIRSAKNKMPKIHSVGLFFKKHPPQGYVPPSSQLTGLGGPSYWNLERLEEGFATDFPWRSSQCLLLWAAMSRNNGAVKVMQEASRLQRFYLPEVYSTKYANGQVFYGAPLSEVVCAAGNIIAYKATLELGRGHPGKCWRDARALYRLARLARQEPDAFGMGGADGLLHQFLLVDRVMLGVVRSHPRELTRIWRIIHHIPLSPPLPARYIHVVRLKALAFLLKCYEKRMQPPMLPLARNFSKQSLPWKMVLHPPAAIDWNWQFSRLNMTFNKLQAMAAAPVYSAAGRHLVSLQNLWTSAWDDISVMAGNSPPVPAGAVGYVPKELGRLFSNKLPLNLRYHNLVLLATNSLYGWDQADYHTLRSLMLVKIAYALEIYRHKYGTYPESLAALSPAIFQHPPLDPTTGEFPIYVKKSNGYELTLYKWMLRPNEPPRVPIFGPQRIIMPPPAPAGWQKGPFP